MPARSPDLLVPLLASNSPVTLDQLQQALGPVSRRTTFRYLRQVRHLRSYNHNGRFYTDRDPARFDRFGLLSLGDVHFSRDGSLPATVRRLLDESEDGCTDRELRALLHVPVHPFLLAAVRQDRARRERLGGVYGLSPQRTRRRPSAPGSPSPPGRQRRGRSGRHAGTGTHHRGAAGAGPPSRVPAGGGGPAPARPLPAHRAGAGAGRVRSLRARRERRKRGVYSQLTRLLEQAREAGWTGARIARATLAGGSPPRVDFVAEQGHCRRCGRVLSQQKSQTRVLATLAAGTFLAREFRKHCRACRSEPVAVCRQLAGLAPPGQRYGYDLLVWVGLARYHRHLQREEIRAVLDRQGITLSSGSVSALCDRFLAALEALHWQRAPALRAGMPHGYALHIDATCDKGKGGTFRCLDGWTGWTLHAVRIGSENERELRPAVERTLAAFGDPIAVMRDLGGAGAKAVADCRQRGIPDLLCQYHFLAAVGHQLLDDSYALLRSQIARSKVRARLRELL